MQQLALFDPPRGESAHPRTVDSDFEGLLREFGMRRLEQGASRRSVLRETSQLRSIARECERGGRNLPRAAVVADISLVAHALREPSVPISRATGRARLLAVQRFLRVMGPVLGRDPEADLKALDALLPARPTSAWHAAGTLVSGEPGRRRDRGPTLDAADLHRIVDAAGAGGHGEWSVRDRALVAVQCFSGLRAEEVVALHWEDLETRLTSVGYYGLTAAIQRGGRRLRLPLPEPTADAIEALRRIDDRRSAPPSGPVFRASRRPHGSLSYREARNVLLAACRRAGLPPAESSDLRAACAHWLGTQGLSDHEVAAVLGVARVRTVDRLRGRHVALDAQRRVRELVGG